MSPSHPFLRHPDQAEGAGRGDRTVGHELDNIFRLTAAQPAVAPAQPKASERPGPTGADGRAMTEKDLDAALDRLSRAAKAMELMQARYGQIEDYAKSVADRAEKDVAAARAQARDWEMRVAGYEAKLEDFRQRVEGADARVASAELRADAAERAAQDARDWLEVFYDKIVTSFDTRTFLRSQAA